MLISPKYPHVVLPLHLNRLLPLPLNPPPPFSFSPLLPPSNPSWATPRHPQPLHVPHLRHDLCRHPPLCRSQDPQNAVVLAALQNPLRVAPLRGTTEAARASRGGGGGGRGFGARGRTGLRKVARATGGMGVGGGRGTRGGAGNGTGGGATTLPRFRHSCSREKGTKETLLKPKEWKWKVVQR